MGVSKNLQLMISLSYACSLRFSLTHSETKSHEKPGNSVCMKNIQYLARIYKIKSMQGVSKYVLMHAVKSSQKLDGCDLVFEFFDNKEQRAKNSRKYGV
jgi:hypothetical protein